MKVYIICLTLFCNSLFAQDGSIDANFHSTINLNTVDAIKEQADGKILIGDRFNTSLFRLNNDGSVDSSFNVTDDSIRQVFCIGLQNDSKIIVSGYSGYIKRLNSDGSVDNSFNCNITSSSAGFIVNNLKILSDGKIMICGVFSNINGTDIYGIAKLNSDGSLDTSFNLNLPIGSGVADFGLQNDNKIIIATGTSTELILSMYNTDNELDTTFNLGNNHTFNSNIYDIEIQSDNKIMICGSFTLFNGQTRFCLARLNANGTLDDTFNSYNYTSYSIFDVKALNDGKYIINGSFNSYNGQSSSKIAKLNNDGTLDTSFNIGTGANDLIWETEIQSDGKIIIGGNFTAFNNFSKNRIARLGNTILSNNENTFDNPEIMIFPNPTEDLIFVEKTNSNLTFTSLKLYNSIGQELKTYKSTEILNNSISLKELSNGIYHLQIIIDGKMIIKKIIKK